MSRFDIQTGVELEAHTSLNRDKFNALLPKNWRTVSDGSIPGGGWEAVSKILTEEDVISGVVSRTAERMRSNGCEFIDAKLYEAPPSYSYDSLVSVRAFRLLMQEAGKARKKGDDKLYRYYKNEAECAAARIQKEMEEAKAYKPPVNREHREQSCGFHVHLSVKDKPFTPRIKGIVQAVYAFYYSQFERFLAKARQLDTGGSASGWCKVDRPELRAELAQFRATGKYSAVNLTSNHPTIEFRQGSMNSVCTPEEWIMLLWDIMRGSFQLDRKYQKMKYVERLYSYLPKSLKEFRLMVWEQDGRDREVILTGEKRDTYTIKDKWPSGFTPTVVTKSPKTAISKVCPATREWFMGPEEQPAAEAQPVISATTSPGLVIGSGAVASAPGTISIGTGGSAISYNYTLSATASARW